jgi:hypothetical protein
VGSLLNFLPMPTDRPTAGSLPAPWPAPTARGRPSDGQQRFSAVPATAGTGQQLGVPDAHRIERDRAEAEQRAWATTQCWPPPLRPGLTRRIIALRNDSPRVRVGLARGENQCRYDKGSLKAFNELGDQVEVQRGDCEGR